MGRLVAGVDVVDARSRLAAARGELRTLAAGLPAGEWADLRASLDGVVTGLRAVLDPPASDGDRAALLTGMDDLVAQVQTVCEFPA